MHICIVGCGNQGVGMAGLLTHEADVERIVFIDSDAARLRGAVRTLESALESRGPSGTRLLVEGCQVDAGDSARVASAAQGCDLILNATIPALNLPVMQAALGAGAHYIDLYSFSRALPGVPDSETVEAQLELDGQFKQAGLTAFPCLGISPGWTTLAAKHLADRLDTVDSLLVRNIDWIESTELLALCNPEIMLGMWLDPPGPVYLENGEVKQRGLLESEELYEFPQPVGRRLIYTSTSLADAILTTKFLGKPVRRLEEKGAVLSGGLPLKDVWITALQKQTARQPGEAVGQQMAGSLLNALGSSFRLAADMDMQSAMKEGIISDGAFASVVEMTGKKDSHSLRLTLSCVSRLQEAIALVPWAVAAAGIFATVGTVPIEVLLMLCRGELSERGVLPITAIGDPSELFERMRRRGHQITENRDA